ncbi:MAG: hypothetical protein GEV03_05125 [Streptosporangiales bacterium]|nr:hypothetical protein [Streptosporangiales bacterium]
MPTESGSRRAYLARLAGALEVQGLAAWMTGRDEAVLLRVINPSSRRSVHVACLPCGEGPWLYLWSRGGQATVEDPAAATRIAEVLS